MHGSGRGTEMVGCVPGRPGVSIRERFAWEQGSEGARKAGWALAHQGWGSGGPALGAGEVGMWAVGSFRPAESQSVSTIRVDQRFHTGPVISSALKTSVLGLSSKRLRGSRQGFNTRHVSLTAALFYDVNIAKFYSASGSRLGSAVCPRHEPAQLHTTLL